MLAPKGPSKHLEFLEQVEIGKAVPLPIHICSLSRLEAEISRHIGTGLLPQEPANRGSPALRRQPPP